MRGREGLLDNVTPRAAAATLLMLDSVLEAYEHENGQALDWIDQRVIRDLLRAVARRDCRVA